MGALYRDEQVIVVHLVAADIEKEPALRLPDFIIFGAPKAATTWMSTVLAADTRIYMPAPELHYFNRNFPRGDAWYASWFDPARSDQLVGEKSASYLADPAVPARLAALVPRASLILQLRDPVERAYSDYCMLVRRGEVDERIDLHLDPVRAPNPRFLNDGLYARHLAPWLHRFPARQIHVLLHDDVKSDAQGSFEGIARFLGLFPMPAPEVLGRRVKDKDTPMLPLPMRRLLKPLKEVIQPWRQIAVMRHAHRLLSRPVRYPIMSNGLRARMAEYFADDIGELERILDRPLEAWRRQQRRDAA